MALRATAKRSILDISGGMKEWQRSANGEKSPLALLFDI
jgi:hypothetical protein